MSNRPRAQVQASSSRSNEYFVPKEGIDREVITADICRYLGNDALVRPGNYEDPRTRQQVPGYFITAYRNLTSEMIADLKKDSQRWDHERRQSASGGRSSGASYSQSATHHSRQQYGPSEILQEQGYGAPAPQVQSYDQGGSPYHQGYNPQPSAQTYAPPQGYAPMDTNYYVAGADRPVAAIPGPQTQQPRTMYAQQPTGFQGDARNGSNTYYTPPPQSAPGQQYPPQESPEQYYGRAAQTGFAYESQESPPYDAGSYSQAQVAPAPTSTAHPSRRDREREERDSRNRRHHR